MAVPRLSSEPPAHLRLIEDAVQAKTRGITNVEVEKQKAERDQRAAEDAELVGRLLQGEPEAFEALYRRHAARVLALSIRIQGHGGDVEDIVHDAFLKAQDKIETLRDPTAFGGWICTIAVSLLRTRMRRRRILGILGVNGHEEFDLEAIVSPEASPETRSQLSQAYLLLQQLSIEERICWTLRYVDGHKLQEVAQLAHCSLATAKRRISVAQDYLQEQMSRGDKSDEA